jgi:O-antigen/teichoic acid export membrane protein
MVPYGKHMTAMALLSVLSSQLDKIVLFVFFGPVSLASFWVASVLPQEFGRFISLIVSTFFPRITKSNSDDGLKLTRKIFILISVVTVALSILYFMIAPFLFEMILPKYKEAALMSSVLMFAYTTIPYYSLWQYFISKKKIKKLYTINLIEPVLLFAGYIVLVPYWGMWGIIVALVIKSSLLNLFSVFYFIKYEN